MKSSSFFTGASPKWFSKHIIDVIEKNKGFEKIAALLKAPIPIKLLVEILEPYAQALQHRKDELQAFALKVAKAIH